MHIYIYIYVGIVGILGFRAYNRGSSGVGYRDYGLNRNYFGYKV